jgi:hypothetical protein
MFGNYCLIIIKHVKLLMVFCYVMFFLCWSLSFGINNSGDDLCGFLFIFLYLSFVVKLLLFLNKKFMVLTYLEPRFDMIRKLNNFFVAWYA